MANMVLAMPVLSDQADITASVSPASLPVTNLKAMPIKQVWRSLDPQNTFLVINLKKVSNFNLIALLGHTGSSRASCRVRAANTEAGLTAAPSYDSGLRPLRSHQTGFDQTWANSVSDEQEGALDENQFILWFGRAGINNQFIRIDIVDPNATWIDIGRLYVSKAWQPETNINYGEAEGMIDPSRYSRSAGGRGSSTAREIYRWVEFTLSFGTKENMYKTAFEIERNRGTKKDVLYIVDPDDQENLQRRTIYGNFKVLNPIINTQFRIFEKSFRIEEIIA